MSNSSNNQTSLSTENNNNAEMNKNKLSPILRTISIGSSAAIFDSNSASHRRSFENATTSNSTTSTVNNNKNSNSTNETYRTKDMRRSSVLFDKTITKRRVSQVKSEIGSHRTRESFDCEKFFFFASSSLDLTWL